MWISRTHYEQLVMQSAVNATDVAKERTKVLLLERQLASSQANVDWLRVMANSLSLDRAAIAAAKGIQLPTPQFSGRLQTAADVAALAAAREREAGGGAPADDPEDAAVAQVGRALLDDDIDGAMAAYGGVVDGFEDVGDEVAAARGITHAEDGTVEYGKP